MEAALTGDISDPVELMRAAGQDVSTFFEHGDWRSFDFRRSDLRDVSFASANMDETLVYCDQYEMIQKTNPRSMKAPKIYPRQKAAEAFVKGKVAHQGSKAMPPPWAIGLKTGIVLDGHIDIAAIRTDGESIAEFGPYELMPYERDVTPLIEAAVADALQWQFSGDEPQSFAVAEKRLTEAHGEAVRGFCDRHGFPRAELAAVGFHGQNVLHRPPETGIAGRTRQLGDGALMARMLGVTVVHDFRSADVAAGGQGAPLSAIYHRAMLAWIGAGSDTAVLNLGGVANLTFFDGESLIAFETGPANDPINDWVKSHGAGAMDRDGGLALAGTVDEGRLAKLLGHPWLTQPFPKSLDRSSFNQAMAAGLSLEDGAATLTAFTAGSVGMALDLLPGRPKTLIVCGSGRCNLALMAALTERARVAVHDADVCGLRGDAVEAECLAYLATRAIAGLPISFPLTTGVPRPMLGGVVNRP